MYGIVPIIDKIVYQDDAYICLDKDDEIIFITTTKEIADMYSNIPALLTTQTEIIVELKTRLEYVTEEYNNLIMGMIPSGSSLIH